jgi:hypothetical protein
VYYGTPIPELSRVLPFQTKLNQEKGAFFVMAKSTKQPPRRGKLKEMPSRNGTVGVAEPPEQAETPQTPFDSEIQAETSPPPHDSPPSPPSQAAPPTPAPARPQGRPRTPGRPEFFDRVASIPTEDWGTRIFLYLYCFEPICDPKIAGEKKYVNRFNRPVQDEQEIMVDYGSGKYRLTLATKKPQGENGPPIETFDFEIYNIKYPPRIPKEVWTNDPRNRRWAALLPTKEEEAAKAAAAAPAINPLDAFGTFMDIQDRIEERIKPTAAAPAAPTATPPNPFDVAQQIMQMRANDPMIAALMQRLDRADAAQEAARQREFDLQKELRQHAQPAAAAPKGLLEQILELAPAQDKFDLVKRLFGGGHSNGTGPLAEGEKIVRAAKMGTLEFLSEVLPKVFDSPIANALATKMMQQPGPQQQAPMNGTARPQVQQPPAVDPFQQFITVTATPAMLEYMHDDAPGDAFAEWMYAAFPRETVRLQKFTHPMIPGLVGAPAIIAGYRNTPDVWPRLAAKEAQFAQFVQEFCNWAPPPDDQPIEAAATPVTDEDGWSQPEREEAAQ